MATSYDWSDLKKIAQNDGNLPLASILYKPEYSNAMDLLREVMAVEEYSERALALTAEIIEMNPAHYTVWEYRLRILKSIGKKVVPEDRWLVKGCGEDFDVVDFADWLDGTTLDNPKNYQIWNYRQLLEPSGHSNVESKVFYLMEQELVRDVVADDSKNFHAWGHLKWVVTRVSERYGEGCGEVSGDIIGSTTSSDLAQAFSLDGQLKFSDQFLVEDVYNNSAWSYRYFIHRLWGILSSSKKIDHEQLFAKELEYVKLKISLAPQNEAVWTYLIGIYEKYNHSVHTLDELEPLCQQYTIGNQVASSHALELLLQIYEQRDDKVKANDTLQILEKLIPIRAGYWEYKKRVLA